jgi:hypothetical protein
MWCHVTSLEGGYIEDLMRVKVLREDLRYCEKMLVNGFHEDVMRKQNHSLKGLGEIINDISLFVEHVMQISVFLDSLDTMNEHLGVYAMKHDSFILLFKLFFTFSFSHMDSL